MDGGEIAGRRHRSLCRMDYYELCWHLCGAQADMAHLPAEDIDWELRVVSYSTNSFSICSNVLPLVSGSFQKMNSKPAPQIAA